MWAGCLYLRWISLPCKQRYSCWQHALRKTPPSPLTAAMITSKSGRAPTQILNVLQLTARPRRRRDISLWTLVANRADLWELDTFFCLGSHLHKYELFFALNVCTKPRLNVDKLRQGREAKFGLAAQFETHIGLLRIRQMCNLWFDATERPLKQRSPLVNQALSSEWRVQSTAVQASCQKKVGLTIVLDCCLVHQCGEEGPPFS